MIVLLMTLFTGVAICVAVMVYSTWALRCNNLTYKQRMKILAVVSKQRDLSEAFDRIKYEDHMRELIFFRDPHNLYPDDLKRAF